MVVFKIYTDVWNYLQNIKKPIIVYGMGNGADKLFNEFTRLNISIAEVIASDSFVRGQVYRGYVVKKLSDIEKTYSDFIIVIAFASQLDDVMSSIFALSEKYTVIAPCTPVFGDNIFNIEFYNTYKNEITFARSLMADEKSLQVFDNYINYMLNGKLHYIKECETLKEEVFNNILKLSSSENYVDLGAYRGDTIDELFYFCNGYNSIHAFEPDRKTYAKLVEHTKNLPNVYTYNLGIWDKNTTLKFFNGAGRNSALTSSGTNCVDVVSLDNMLCGKKISYIKMDIEGAEKQGIIGATEILKTQKPKLNIAMYHRNEDLFTLPILINSINPTYKFYLRHHPYIPFWDTNLYCV